MQAARRNGTIVSYDLNYRASLWKVLGGKKQAQEVNRRIAPHVDVMLGNEEDFSAALGYEVPGMDEHLSAFEVEGFKQMIGKVVKDYPFKVVATTLRKAKTATLNDWGAICYCDGKFYQAKNRENLEIFDRVGGGDSFASGLTYGFLAGQDPQWAVECEAAHGALAMTTPGDTGMVTLKEVMQVMEGVGARILVSPGLNLETVEFAVSQGVLMMAGALTPTEVITAWKAGSDFVKVFPCGNVGGAKYIKALKGPLPQVPLVPSGGVNLDTAAEFIEAGAAALGVGGELLQAEALKTGKPEIIVENARKFLKIVKETRARMASAHIAATTLV